MVYGQLVRKRAAPVAAFFASQHPYAKRARMAYSVGKFAYSNRRRAYRAARTIGRAWKRARRSRSRRSRIDTSPQSGKQIQRFIFGSNSTTGVLERKTLHASIMRFANAPDSNDGLRQAPAMTYTCSGFSLCGNLFNTSTTDPIYVHMAIIQPKEDEATLAHIRTDMLRDTNSTNQRHMDFTDFALVPGWDWIQSCAPLNPKKFNIFTHKKYIIPPNNSNYSGRPMIHIKSWNKLNKRFAFQNTTATEVEKPMWFLMWYESCAQKDVSMNALGGNISFTSYVKDNNGCC